MVVMRDNAVIGLPMRLLISIVVGGAVILTVNGFLNNIDLLPKTLSVTVSPIICYLDDNNIVNLSFQVSSRDGEPIANALVVVKGLNGLSYNRTNKHGVANISVTVNLPDDAYEGFLDVFVEATGYSKYEQKGLVRVVRRR